MAPANSDICLSSIPESPAAVVSTVVSRLMSEGMPGSGVCARSFPTTVMFSCEREGIVMRFGPSSWWQRRIRLERDVISGWIAHEQGRASAAVQLIGNAAEEELSAGKLSVEPGHTLYAVEQLGELLLELDRPREALEAFRRSLADSPKRFHSLFGAGRAAELAKMDEEAAKYYAALTEMVVVGNDRPQVQHASDFLAKAKQ